MEQFTFKQEWMGAIGGLSDPIRLEVYDAIVSYALSGTLVQGLKPMARLAFEFVKGSIDCERERLERISAKRKEAGRMGGTKKAENLANLANAKQMLANLANATFARTESEDGGDADDVTRTVTESCENNDVLANATFARNDESVCTLSNNIYNNISLDNTSESVEKEKECEKREKPKDLKASMEKRRAKFYESLVPYVERYGKEMVREFYDYWTEPNKSGTKMRFELERTWSLARRLGTWAKRDNEFRTRKVLELRQTMAPDLTVERQEQEERMKDRDRWREEAVSWEEYQESLKH